MIYAYECRKCGNDFEVIKPIAEIDRNEACPACSAPEAQRYISRTHFYGANDWDKAEFNPAFGQIVRNRFHRKELAKRHGMEEIGNENVESVHKHFETEKQRQLDAVWER